MHRTLTPFILFSLLLVGCEPGPQEKMTPTPATSVRAAPKGATLRVSYLRVSTTLPLFMAIEKGYLKEAGIDVEVADPRPTSQQLFDAWSSGAVDATGVLADETMLRALAKGGVPGYIYLKEYNVPEVSQDALVVRADSGIASVKDLSGKSIICFPSDQQEYYLRKILEANGVDPSTVKIKRVPPPLHLSQLLAEGSSYAAAYSLEPTMAIGRHKGKVKVLLESPRSRFCFDGKALPTGSFLVSKAWCEANPEAARGLVRAIDRAVDDIRKDYKAASAFYPKINKGIAAEFADTVANVPFWKTSELDAAALQAEAKLLESVLGKKVDTSSLLLPETYWK